MDIKTLFLTFLLLICSFSASSQGLLESVLTAEKDFTLGVDFSTTKWNPNPELMPVWQQYARWKLEQDTSFMGQDTTLFVSYAQKKSYFRAPIAVGLGFNFEGLIPFRVTLNLSGSAYAKGSMRTSLQVLLAPRLELDSSMSVLLKGGLGITHDGGLGKDLFLNSISDDDLRQEMEEFFQTKNVKTKDLTGGKLFKTFHLGARVEYVFETPAIAVYLSIDRDMALTNKVKRFQANLNRLNLGFGTVYRF